MNAQTFNLDLVQTSLVHLALCQYCRWLRQQSQAEFAQEIAQKAENLSVKIADWYEQTLIPAFLTQWEQLDTEEQRRLLKHMVKIIASKQSHHDNLRWLKRIELAKMLDNEPDLR